MCDYQESVTTGQTDTQTDGQTDAGQSDPYVPSDWEGKGPCAIVPLTWKMAHQSLCRMIRNDPLKFSKSLKKAENGPLAKISSQSLCATMLRKRHKNYGLM